MTSRNFYFRRCVGAQWSEYFINRPFGHTSSRTQEENRFMMCDLLNHCEADLEGAVTRPRHLETEKTCLSTKGSTRININNRLIKLNMFLDVCLLCSTGQGQNKTHENDEWPALSRARCFMFTLLHSLSRDLWGSRN